MILPDRSQDKPGAPASPLPPRRTYRCFESPQHFDDGTPCACYRRHKSTCPHNRGLTCTCGGPVRSEFAKEPRA